MTQVSDIVSSAFREAITDVTQHPAPAQFNEAMVRFNSLVKSVYGAEVGELLYDWPLGTANYAVEDPAWVADVWQYPAPNRRLVVALASSTTVYLPADPRDGARVGVVDPMGLLPTKPVTLSGNGRAIESAASVTLNTVNLEREWMYRADKGGWLRLATLAKTDEMPFPEEYDDFFITSLAMRVNPRYGRSIDDQTFARLEQVRSRIRARYRQSEVVPADPCVNNLTTGYGATRGNRSVLPGRFGWMF